MLRPLVYVRTFFANHEPLMFVAALVAVLGLWGFAAITDEVMHGQTQRFDVRILKAFRDPADPARLIGPDWALTVARDITAMGGAVVMGLIVLASAGFLFLARRYHTVIFLLLTIAGATIVNVSIKQIVARQRPDIVPHLTDVSSASFPSGHSAMSAALYLTLGAILAQSVEKKRLKLYFVFVAMCLTGLVGLSRIALGVHYPSDVLAGWSTGLVWALICWLIARYLQRRGAIEKESDDLPAGVEDAH